MESKIRAVIIEDEFKARVVFCSLIEKFCPEIDIVGEAENISNGYELIIKEKPQLVFLDIEMPGGNGFELLSKFENPPFETIFVTSYSHYAIKAIKYSALDYLLKPVMIEELELVVSRYKEKNELKFNAEHYKLLKENLSGKEQKLIINLKNKLEQVTINDIIYLKADGNYTFIVSKGEKKYYTSKTLKEYDELLCSDENELFMRVHKSFIVNIKYIQSIEKGEYLLLNDDTRIEVSRRKRQELFNRIETSMTILN